MWFSKTSLSVGVCVYMSACLCMMHRCVQTCGSLRLTFNIFGGCSTPFFMRQDLSLAWGSPVWLDLQDSEAQGSLSLPSLVVQLGTATPSFLEGPRVRPQVLQHFPG